MINVVRISECEGPVPAAKCLFKVLATDTGTADAVKTPMRNKLDDHRCHRRRYRQGGDREPEPGQHLLDVGRGAAGDVTRELDDERQNCNRAAHLRRLLG